MVERKFPQKKDDIDRFLANTSYEFAYTPHKMKADIFEIRDINSVGIR